MFQGAGNGIVFSSSIVAVTRYFDKRRGIALGLNMAGPPMTSLLVPKLLQWLLGEYGLRGTFLLLSGCMANIPILGILLRNPPWEKIQETTAVEMEHCFTEVANGNVQLVSPATRNGESCDGHRMKACRRSAGGKRRPTGISITNHNGVRRDTINPSRVPASKGTASSVNADRRLSAKPWPLVPDHRPSNASRRSTFASSVSDVTSNGRVSSIASTVSPRNVAMERRGTVMSVAGSMFASKSASRNDAFSRRGTVVSVIGLSAPGDTQNATVEAPSSALSSLKEVLSAPRMYFHTFSFFTCAFFVDSYLTVMFDLGEDIGVPVSQSVLALSILSAMDTVGRFFVPFLTDYGVTSTASLLTLCYISLAVISVLMPCVSGRLVFLAVSALLGLPGGYVLVGTSETLSKELGTKNLPMAYGVLAFIAALGGFARPPVVGKFV
ncbi:hypothetical protein HPB49_015253 [Dermacentor silvarum]|uniref:Uncharacterized protein n=1 Tax=Dermacentor silvarum TaxID=543639 RepID=A0ACB8D674_DERSI|nr:hypothetical protein HPB49_015253 [Dermacentor silvarum]